jgi:hypothetical protein
LTEILDFLVEPLDALDGGADPVACDAYEVGRFGYALSSR